MCKGCTPGGNQFCPDLQKGNPYTCEEGYDPGENCAEVDKLLWCCK